MKRFFRGLRLSFWFIKAFINKHRLFLLFSFLAGFLITLGLIKLSSGFRSVISSWQIKKIAVVGTYTPTSLPGFIQNYISLGLTSLDSSGEATPSLASRWEVKEEGKVYVFYLKSDVTWHDGTKFKSSDVNYNLKGVKFEPISEEVLKITLKEPFSPLPTVLARPIFKKGLVGVGPYKLKKMELKGGNLELISLTPVNENLPPIEFRFYPTETMAITAFKLGKVNVLERISQVDNFTSWPNVSVTHQTYFNYNLNLFYNTKLPLLQRKGMRQALTYGLPVFSEEKSIGPLNPQSWAYYPKVKIYQPNFETAINLLEKEGVSTTSAELTISTFLSFLPDAQKIASSWENLGIKTHVKVENSLPSNFDVLLLSQEIPADPDQYHLWHSTQPTNLSGFASPRIDKLLEDGRKTDDKEKRLKIYQDFQRYLAEETPVAFLYHPKLYSIERK